ncbi:MAG: MG2 domain-containing protein [Candidatus Thorarchaeota archaeon]
MAKTCKLLNMGHKKSMLGIVIINVFLLQLVTGITTGMGTDTPVDSKQSFDLSLNDVNSISNDNIIPGNSNPSIERLIERETADLYDRRLQIPTGQENATLTSSSSSSTATSANVVINIDLKKQFYVPGETVRFLVQLTADFKPVSGESVIASIYFGGTDDLQATFSGVTNSDGFWEGTFDPTEEGVYILEVSRPSYESVKYQTSSGPSRWAEFTVSSLGVFWRHPWEFVPGQEIQSFALVLNTSTLSSVENAQLNLSIREYESDWEQIYSGISDSNGICYMNYTIDSVDSYSYEANLTAYFNGKSVSVVQWLYKHWDYYYDTDESLSGRFEIITTTDKPLYNPGETIYFRSLVWEQNYLAASKKPIQVPIELTFVSPSGYTLLRKLTQTNQNGIISDSVSLDEEAELGNYSIIAKVGSSSSTVVVKVDRYDRPDFRITTSIRPNYKSGKIHVDGTIVAEYYFGQPVAEGQVELEVLRKGRVQQSKSGILSTKGEWSFSISLSESDDNYIISGKVTDSVDRSVEFSQELPGKSDIEVYGYISPYVALPDDEIRCNVWAYDRSSSDYYWGRPVKQGIAYFTIYGMNPFFFGSASTKLKELDANLNEWGYASVSWSLSPEEISQYASFKVKIQIKTSDGREGSTEEHYGYSRNIVKISIPDSPFQPGDEVTLKVTVRDRFSNRDAKVDGTLYVFDRDWDAIVYGDKTFTGTTSTTFRLSPYAKSGEYLVGLHVHEEVGWDDYYWHYYQYIKGSFAVGSETPFSLSTTKLSFVMGEIITISGSHYISTNGPLIVETVKRGIVGLYVLEPTNTFSLEIKDNSFLAPEFYVNAYLIDHQGELQTASLLIEVNDTMSLDIQFDKALYEPGDAVEITMAMKNAVDSNISAIAAVSFVDSSVYDVFADSEDEKSHFEEEKYYPAVMTRTSWVGSDFYWWWVVCDIYYGGGVGFARGGGVYSGFEEDISAPASQKSLEGGLSAEQASPKQEIEIRDDFPESAYWHPEIFITENGTNLSLVLPDNIGEWILRAVATTASGQGVLQKASLKTFLPFFVDLEKPLTVYQDDVIAIKGVAYNYLNETVSVDLQLDVSAGLEPLIAAKQSLILPSHHLGSIEWPVYIQSFGNLNVSLIGIAMNSEDTWTDGMRVSLPILPNGASRVERQGGYLNGSVELPIIISKSAISIQATLALSPGLSDVALSSWERLIGYPYGCVEQTLSRLVPDALVYAYLNQTNQLDPETAKSLENMITAGLSRLYSFQHPSRGGWGWWSDDQSNAYMTATVLYGLSIIRNAGFVVDSKALSSGAKFLLQQQESNGSWKTSVWRLDGYSFTAFVLRSLMYLNSSYDSHSQVQSAYAVLKNSWNESRNPYAAALLLEALGESNILEIDFKEDLIGYLHSSAIHAEEGTFWTIDDRHWRALGGTVETTAVATIALARNDFISSFSLIQRAMDWITSRQRAWGWGNTADTAAAIRALLIVEEKASTEPIEANISVILNGNKQVLSFDEKSPQSLVSRFIKLNAGLQEGTNSLEVVQNGTGLFFYLLTVEQVFREHPSIEIDSDLKTAPGSEFPVSITISPPSGDVGIVDFQIKSLEEDIPISSPESMSLSKLSEKTTLSFVYTAPLSPGILSLDGFEISYYFQDLNSTSAEVSQIPVVRHYGPIMVSVIPGNSATTEFSVLSQNIHDNVEVDTTGDLDDPEFQVRKKLSKTRNLSLGETVLVTLEISYTGETDKYFLMIEDYQSAGLEPDQSSLSVTSGISDISYGGDRVTIFIPHLAPGSFLVYSYRVFVTDIQTSVIHPALLSSMYDEWVVMSQLEEFSASSRLSMIDPITQEISKDYEKPVISEQTSAHFRSEDTSILLEIEGTATDNLGLGEIRLLGGTGEIWANEEIPLSGKSSSFVARLKIDVGDARLNAVTAIIEVRDQFGNVEIRVFQQDVETFIIDPIPVLGIVALVVIAVLAALAVSRSVAYWGRKRLNK